MDTLEVAFRFRRRLNVGKMCAPRGKRARGHQSGRYFVLSGCMRRLSNPPTKINSYCVTQPSITRRANIAERVIYTASPAILQQAHIHKNYHQLTSTTPSHHTAGPLSLGRCYKGSAYRDVQYRRAPRRCLSGSLLGNETDPHKQSIDHSSEEIMGETHYLMQKYPAIPIMSGEYEATVAVKRLEQPKGKGVPRDWPKTAQRLKHNTTWTYLARCWDVWVTLLPIVFLGEYKLQSCNPVIRALRSCLRRYVILTTV